MPSFSPANMVLEDSDVEMIVAEIEVSVSKLLDLFTCYDDFSELQLL